MKLCIIKKTSGRSWNWAMTERPHNGNGKKACNLTLLCVYAPQSRIFGANLVILSGAALNSSAYSTGTSSLMWDGIDKLPCNLEACNTHTHSRRGSAFTKRHQHFSHILFTFIVSCKWQRRRKHEKCDFNSNSYYSALKEKLLASHMYNMSHILWEIMWREIKGNPYNGRTKNARTENTRMENFRSMLQKMPELENDRIENSRIVRIQKT